MGLFKKLYSEKIFFSEKDKNSFKLLLKMESVKHGIILTYVENNIKQQTIINEKSIDKYRFIRKTNNMFYKQFQDITTSELIKEMDTGTANVGITGDTQFSGDFYAQGDSRNLFGSKNKKMPMARRPKIKDTFIQPKKNKKKKKSKGGKNGKK